MAAKKKRVRKPKVTDLPSANGVTRAPPQVPGLRSGAMSAPVARQWDMRGVILSYSLNLVEGRKSVGKSSIMAAIAASFAGGPALPGEPVRQPEPILWHCPEEDWYSESLPRLIAAGADPAWCFQLDLQTADGAFRRLSLPSMIDDLGALMAAQRTRMLVLDPLNSACDFGLDLRYDQPIRQYLEPLARVCRSLGVTTLLSRHLRKGRGGDARDSGMGGTGILNVCRSGIRLDEHLTEPGLFVLTNVASNWAARDRALLYRLPVHGEGVRVDWCGEVRVSADRMAEGGGGASERDETRDATELLKTLLARGPVPSSEVLKEAEQAGIGKNRIRDAKTALGIKPRRKGGGDGGPPYWEWVPPEGGWPQV